MPASPPSPGPAFPLAPGPLRRAHRVCLAALVAACRPEAPATARPLAEPAVSCLAARGGGGAPVLWRLAA